MKKYLYVAFIRSNTKAGKIIRKITGWKYSHVSISLNQKLDEYYAFSRLNYKSSFMASFTKEYKSNYTLMKNTPAEATYYKIPITTNEYNSIKEFVEEIESDSEYIFNYPSMFTTTILHGFELYKSYNCITFVSKILTFISTVNLTKKYYKYDLNELEEDIKDFYYKKETFVVDKIEGNNHFFDDIKYFKRKSEEIKLIRECFYRIIHKRSSKRYNKNYYEDDIKYKTIRAFNNLSKTYDKGFSGYNPRKNYKRIVDSLKIDDKYKIADIGCGTGELLYLIRKKNSCARLYGIDISPKMIEKAKSKKIKNVFFSIGDAEKLNFDNNTMDIIITSESFHHYPYPQKALEEVNRVLKPNGLLVLCDMYRPTPIRQAMNFMFKFTNTGDVKMYNRKEITKLISNSNFKIVRNEYFYSSYIYWCKKIVTNKNNKQIIK